MPIRRQGAQKKIAKNKRERFQRDHILLKYVERMFQAVFAICDLYVIYDFGWIWCCTPEIRRCAATEIMRV